MTSNAPTSSGYATATGSTQNAANESPKNVGEQETYGNDMASQRQISLGSVSPEDKLIQPLTFAEQVYRQDLSSHPSPSLPESFSFAQAQRYFLARPTNHRNLQQPFNPPYQTSNVATHSPRQPEQRLPPILG